MTSSQQSAARGCETRLYRRRILQLSGLGGSALLAGCSGGGDDGDDGGPDDRNETGTNDDNNGDVPDDDPSISPEFIEVEAGGNGFGGEADEGHFYYEEISGDFDVAVHVNGVENASEDDDRHGAETGGIMLRESLDDDAATLFVRRRAHPDTGYITEQSHCWATWRTEAGENTDVVSGPRGEWLRLRREGSTIEVYTSFTGHNWTRYASEFLPDLEIGEDAYLGLAAGGSGDLDRLTVTFKDLTGLSPSKSADIGEPEHEGEVTVSEDIAFTTTLEPQLEAEELTLRGGLYLPDEYDEAECFFAYRRYDEDDWHETEAQTLAESGTFEETVDGVNRRIYLIIARIEVDGMSFIAESTPSIGTTVYRGTPSANEEKHGDEPLSTGISSFSMDDGFADPAPWLNDDTPIITITEPSRSQIYEAFRVPHERLIVFETSGEIDLGEDQMNIRTDNCYVAGQTAPAPGISFSHNGIQIAADNCVIQHIRSRPGGTPMPTAIYVQDRRINNVVDHCTTMWSPDENLTVGGESIDTTYTNNLVAEGLVTPYGNEVRGYGSLINPGADTVALLGNIWANNRGRNPRLRVGSQTVVANNLTYNYDDGAWLDPQARTSFVGNYYERPRSDKPLVFERASEEYAEGVPKAYVEDNYDDGDGGVIDDAVEELSEPPLWPDGFEAIPVEEVREHNIQNAGARPAERSEHDERVIDSIRTDDGEWVDHEDEIGGFPDVEENTESIELPESNTREWLRELAREVET